MTQKLNIKKITSFLNNEYKEYSRYTVEERALPSVCDGFKPGARKIMHAAFVGCLKDNKIHKLLALSGEAMNISQFSHGDASLNASIVTLSKSFISNLNPLEIDGQGGSLRDPDAAGSPRYLYIKKSKYMDKIFKTDYDLLEYVFDEGMYLEPKQYFPIIPTVLTSMTMGIANGYSFHTMAYNPIDIIDACVDVLKANANKKDKIKTVLRPYLRNIKQENWKFSDGKWWNYGEWKTNQAKDLLTVTDLPCDVSYEDFEKLLNRLVDKEYIKSYKNLSKDGNINYEITFPKKQLAVEMKRDRTGNRIANTFKLIKEVPDDLLWFLDENHKLKYFENKNAVIEYFVNWRLTIYAERKKKLVKILEQRYKENSDLVRFIELVCKGKLKIRNRSKKDIKIDMDGFKLPIALISTSMSKCTIEERNELLKQNEEIKKELDYIKNTSEKEMYLNDLNNLKNDIGKDFK